MDPRPLPSDAPPPSRWIWIASFGTAVLVAAVAASQVFFAMLDHGHQWWRIFAWELGSWVCWAAMAPAVVAAGARLLRPETRRPLWPLRLLAGAAATTVGQLLVSTLCLLAFQPFEPIETYGPLSGLAYAEGAWLKLGPFIYFGLVVVGYGFGGYLQAKAAQLRQARLEAELARAQLEALRREIQPHFLFNTLNSISAQVRKGAAAEALEMLLALSELLRTTLERSMRPLVTLAEEVDLLRRYVGLQQVRFADRLRVSFDVDPACLELAVPVLLLQPLVENAIRHGFSRRPGPGSIDVRAERRGDRLLLAVLDDGAGLPPDFDLATHAGVGLANTRSRLERTFEGDTSLMVRGRSSGGVRVLVELPARRISAAPRHERAAS